MLTGEGIKEILHCGIEMLTLWSFCMPHLEIWKWHKSSNLNFNKNYEIGSFSAGRNGFCLKRGGLDYSFLFLGVVFSAPQLLHGCGDICRALYAGCLGHN